MTKITLGNVTPRAVQELRGVAVFRATKSGIVVQKWPDFSKSKRSPAQIYLQKRFAFAATMAANPEPMQLATAIEMAKGTEQVPRDILTMAALGSYYELVHPDGTPWGHVPLFPIPPDPAEEELMWQWNYWDAAWSGTINTAAYASKGIAFIPKTDLTVKKLRAVCGTNSAGQYTGIIAAISSTNVITDLIESEPYSPGSTGNNLLTFDVSMNLSAGQRYALLVARKDNLDTFALVMLYQTNPRWLIPITNVGQAFLAKRTPSIGDALTLGTTNNSPFGLLLPATE